MKRDCLSLFCAVAVALAWLMATPTAQNAAKTPAEYVAAAKAAVAPKTPGYQSWQAFEDSYARMCNSPANPIPQPPPTGGGAGGTHNPAAPKSYWYTEPAKVFDNLYYVGLNTGQASWAVVDPSGGIILIDTGWDYTAQDSVIDGLKKLNLDPSQIRYILISHGHADHFGGSKYLQDHLASHPRIAISAADWELVEKNDEIPEANKPKKDMVATDGQKVTVGTTTVTVYVTPGHTPGTPSFLIPLKDGNQMHLGGMAGGVILGRAPAEQIRTYLASATRFRDTENKAGVDVLLSTIDRHDSTSGKIAAVRTRKPGTPHPFVGKDLVNRYWDVLMNCESAQLAWASPAAR